MPRIAGVNIPMQKHIVIGLRAIYGIGPTRAHLICDHAQVKTDTKVKDLTETALNAVRKAIDTYRDEIEGNLRRTVAMHIKRWKDISSYRGRRHHARLPVHGQRTRTNAQTRKRSRA